MKVRNLVNSISHDESINAETNFFISELNKLNVACFPLKVKFVSPKRLCKPWISSAILQSIKNKAKYFKLCKLGIISNELNRVYRNKLNSVIRLAKQTYFKKMFSDYRDDIRKTWKTIRVLLTNSANRRQRALS